MSAARSRESIELGIREQPSRVNDLAQRAAARERFLDHLGGREVTDRGIEHRAERRGALREGIATLAIRFLDSRHAALGEDRGGNGRAS